MQHVSQPFHFITRVSNVTSPSRHDFGRLTCHQLPTWARVLVRLYPEPFFWTLVRDATTALRLLPSWVTQVSSRLRPAPFKIGAGRAALDVRECGALNGSSLCAQVALSGPSAFWGRRAPNLLRSSIVRAANEAACPAKMARVV